MRPALLATAAMILMAARAALAQPMSGPYSVGGAAPDFQTPLDAANALMSRGVSGPVSIQLRPGTYTRNGGASPVLVLTGSIAGIGPSSRITFEPDPTASGNVNNVILQADFNSSSPQRFIAIVRTDHTVLRNLTFADADSMDTPVGTCIDASSDVNNPSLEGLEVDGCVFLGTPYFPQAGTDIGIASQQNLTSARFTRNRFHRIRRGITNENGNSRGGTIFVGRNEFYQGFMVLGTNHTGTAIELACARAIVRQNIIDLAGGHGALRGIALIGVSSAIVERNLIINRVPIGGPFDNFTGISVRSPFFPVDSVLIANNVVLVPAGGGTTLCASIETPHTKVLYNTFLLGGGPGVGNTALRLTGADATVLNNIMICSAGYMVFDQGAAQGLVSDYNVIFGSEATDGLVRSGGTDFTSLAGYQAATGLDTHSVSKSVLFSDAFHLDDCQAQDPDLIGTPIADISIDFDSDARHPTDPFRGADESVRTGSLFGEGFRAGLPGPPLSLAAGDFFDDDGDDDIAAPDYQNQQVLLFRNLGPVRSFNPSGALSTTVQPTVIQLVDLDGDGHLDLVVGGDSPAVDVFWGEAAGGFGTRVTVPTFGRVRSLEYLPANPVVSPAIVITEDDGFLPSTAYLGFINHLGGRQLCHELLHRQGPPPSFFHVPDTISTILTDLVIGDLDGTGAPEIVALGDVSPAHQLVVFHGLTRPFLNGLPCDEAAYEAPRLELEFGTTSYVGHNSSIVTGDFDGDGDNDLLTTTVSENECRLIRNQGNLTFVPETIPAPRSRGLVALDFDNDSDLDFIVTHRTLDDRGITLFLNDGSGQFAPKPHCFFPFASGFPNGIVASDFDGDGRTDIAIASSFDSLFVVYNLAAPIISVGVNDPPAGEAPAALLLSQNHPNPFGLATTIAFQLPVASHVTVRVYDLSGREIATVLDETRAAGRHTATWNGTSNQGARVARGVYFYRLQTRPGNGASPLASARRMILLR